MANRYRNPNEVEPWAEAVERLQGLARMKYYGNTGSRAEMADVLGEPIPERSRNEYSDINDVITYQLAEAVYEARTAGLGRTKFKDVRGYLSHSDIDHLLDLTDTPRYESDYDIPRSVFSVSVAAVTGHAAALEAAGDATGAARLRRNGRAFLRQWIELTMPPEMPETELSQRPALRELFDARRKAYKERRHKVMQTIRQL